MATLVIRDLDDEVKARLRLQAAAHGRSMEAEAPSEAVVAWLDEQDADEVRLTAIGVAELRAGVALLPSGRRRQRIAALIETLISETFSGRYSRSMARAPRITRTSSPAGAAPGTRSAPSTRSWPRSADSGTGVELINPWEEPTR